MTRRFAWIKKEIWAFLVELDVLGLRASLSSTLPLTNARPRPKEFAFRSDPEKLKAFRDWLDKQINEGVITVNRSPWTERYIKSAYEKGVNKAFTAANKLKMALDEQGFIAGQSMHLKQLLTGARATRQIQMLGTRAFEELKGVSTDMAGKMNRILAQGFLEGKSAKAIAKEMSKQTGLSLKRAKVIASTEVVRANAEGMLDSLERLGIDKVGVKAEWHTANDERVCEQCAPNEGKIFSIDDARGMIPVHPRCRCSFEPIIAKRGKRKRNS